MHLQRVLEAPERESSMKTVNAARRAEILAIAGFSVMSATAALAEEITVWSWDANFNGAAMSAAAERYAKINPDVTFNLVDFAKASVEQKLQTQLASGTTEGLPDIVLIEDYGAQKYLLSFPGAFEPLSAHELAVLRLLGTEMSGPEIARERVVSLNTIRTQTQHIYAKLGVNNRRAAVRRAEELGLL